MRQSGTVSPGICSCIQATRSRDKECHFAAEPDVPGGLLLGQFCPLLQKAVRRVGSTSNPLDGNGTFGERAYLAERLHPVAVLSQPL